MSECAATVKCAAAKAHVTANGGNIFGMIERDKTMIENRTPTQEQTELLHKALIDSLRNFTSPGQEIAKRDAEIERYKEALRQCRRAVSGKRADPRRNVRAIVDEALGQKTSAGGEQATIEIERQQRL